MYEVGVVANFDATHHLHGDFGPASQPHGHSYRIEARASGPRLRPDGTLLDITSLQTALSSLCSSLQDRSLNTVPELEEANPTAEVLARYAWQHVAAQLPDGASTLTVIVWESPDAFASFAQDLP
jgi:6-pyruvoyltetrahydropterin/6-carboxytetrahydropterin synthase